MNGIFSEIGSLQDYGEMPDEVKGKDLVQKSNVKFPMRIYTGQMIRDTMIRFGKGK